MSAVYLASNYGNAANLRIIRDTLRTNGHTVTSSWIDCEVTPEDNARRDANPDPAERVHWAHVDLSDIDAADVLVLVNPPQLVRGGCHVEFGYALGQGKPTFVIGRPTNVFTYLGSRSPDEDYAVPALLAWLDALERL